MMGKLTILEIALPECAYKNIVSILVGDLITKRL